MAKFWYTEPLQELLQRPGHFEFGLYPAIQYHGSTNPHTIKNHPYNLEVMTAMLAWCSTNVAHPMTYSERYGSFYFSDEKDRAMFRLFHGDETMPEPDLTFRR